MTLGKGEVSLSRQLPLAAFRQAAAHLTAGMSEAQVRAEMTAAGADESLAPHLFKFDTAGLVEDELIRVCQSGDAVLGDQMVWIARVLADHRLAAVIENGLTTATGKLDPARISRPVVEGELTALGVSDSSLQKSASNVLGYLVQARMIAPVRHGSTIVGIADELPTSPVVPHVVTYVTERLARDYLVKPAPGASPVDLALGLGVNRWLNLTPDEFRAAASPTPVAAAVTARGTLPAALDELHQELQRRGQVVLQGPPGVGKTHVALEYVAWSTGGRRDEAHLTRIVNDLPSHERTPARAADAVVALGLPSVWELVQFHASYGYEDFVRTLAAHPVPTGVTFKGEHRALSFLAGVGRELALRGASAEVVLVLDELNRADISRVFGELLFALEYRDRAVTTPYEVDGDRSLALPGSLRVIGTMNTADRSIAMIDFALRRRFTFLDMRPDGDVVRRAAWHGSDDRNAAVALFAAVQELFAQEAVGEQDPRSLAIGPSYFLPDGTPLSSADEGYRRLARRFAYETIPLLNEYVAEGMLDRSRVHDLFVGLGVADPAASQRGDAAAVEDWLRRQSVPPAPAPVAPTSPVPTVSPPASAAVGASASQVSGGGPAAPSVPTDTSTQPLGNETPPGP